MPVIIYHNPRCSKSRQTLALVEAQCEALKVVDYLKNPPTKAELKRLLKLLGMEPRELMRQKEPEYKTLGLDNPALRREQLIEAMVQHPILIERPIVVNGNRAALGRPPEDVLEIL